MSLPQRKEYWVNKENNSTYCCPNVSLFRFLGQCGVEISGKNIVDFGFGANYGSDLLEMSKRGAKYALGVDINPVFVNDFVNQVAVSGLDNVAGITMDMACIEKDKLIKNIDILITRDTINYLNEAELVSFMSTVKHHLNVSAQICLQFVEADISLPASDDMEFMSLDWSRANFKAS